MRDAHPARSTLGRGSQCLPSPRAGAGRAEEEPSNLCSRLGAAPSTVALPCASARRVLPEKGIVFPFPMAVLPCFYVAGACTQEFYQLQLGVSAPDAHRVLDAGRFGEAIRCQQRSG